MVLEKTLERPLDSKGIKAVNFNGINPEYSLKRLMLKLKLHYFGYLMQRAYSVEMRASFIAQLVKNPPAMQETLVRFLVRKICWRRDRLPTTVFLGFPGGSVGKESAYNVGDLGLIPGLGRSPGGGYENPFQYSWLENPHGQRSLVGFTPWRPKASDTTEQLSSNVSSAEGQRCFST